MKKNKNRTYVFVTSALCLLPIIFSIIIINKLPSTIPIHWNMSGKVDSYGNTSLIAFGLPVLFFIINLIINVVISNDPLNTKQVTIVKAMASFILSLSSIILVPSLLIFALGYSVNIVDISVAIVSIMLIFIGNYLPKTKQNYSIGIRIPWTLLDSENWRRTHRLAGYLWIASGTLLLLSNIFFIVTNSGNSIKSLITIIIILIISLCPISYSFLIYKNNQ